MSTLEHFIGNAQEFPILSHWDFFNHAAVAPLPAGAADAMRTYCRHAEEQAYVNAPWYKQLESLRRSAASLINASPEEIAFVKNTSEGLALVANGIDWKPGDRIVTATIEYPANIYPWMDLRNRLGVELVLVDEEEIDGTRQVPLQKILAAADHPKTRLLTLSHVEFGSGQRHDLAAIGQFCRERNILFCVDAIQTLGLLPVDVQSMRIDYLSADGHKWLLGPEGAGIFYIRKDLIERTRPSIIGWMNVINDQDFGHIDFTLKPDARRYEPGSPNIPGFLALQASLEMLFNIGIDKIAGRVKTLGDRLITGLTEKGYTVISPRAGQQWSGSVSFLKPSLDLPKIAHTLREEHRTEISLRLGRLRASPHFYNTESQIDRLLEKLPD
jgi:cysteine desulfurase/selenocysteine lyase